MNDRYLSISTAFITVINRKSDTSNGEIWDHYSSSRATKEDCYEGRFCCFGVCAKTCNVKKRPTAKCRKFQHCARNEYCKRGFCALLPGEDQIPTRSPDDGGQHPVYPVFPTYP
uniref:Uncharacterized protein n=1 Tax=Setaria digitata TaxID=48799 RepID=A0A915PKB0_9BILA